MILPNERQALSSPNDIGDHDQATPPPYQEAVPPTQILPSERPTTSPYAPSVSSRSDPPRERELPPHPTFPDEKSGEKGKEGEIEGPSQRALGAFSSMVWGPTSSAPASLHPPNPASTSQISTVESRDPLNPAPAAFTRLAPTNYAYLQFQPMTMLGTSPKLADGFPLIPPPINCEDETGAARVDTQHPFVSHDVTEEDWLKFLADLKFVALNPNQAQKSFLARIFQGEPSERDRRKRAVRFIDSWNHYFFQPRRMSVILARGHRTFSGASNNRHPHTPGHHRRHSIGDDRGRDTDPTPPSGHRNRHRSLSTDSSSSSSSSSSSFSSSIRSTASELPEMPLPHLDEPSPGGPFDDGPSSEHKQSGHNDRKWDPDTGAESSALGTTGSSTVPTVPGMHGELESREPGPSHDNHLARHEQKRARREEKRGMKYERRRAKRAVRFEKRAAKHERHQHRRELKAARRAEGGNRRDHLWKLLIFFHGARQETAQS